MFAVTAASGKLGVLVLEGLMKVAPAGKIVAIARSPEKLAHLQERGVKVRRGDYSEFSTLGPSLAGVKRLLLIAGMDLGQRAAPCRDRGRGGRRSSSSSLIRACCAPT